MRTRPGLSVGFCSDSFLVVNLGKPLSLSGYGLGHMILTGFVDGRVSFISPSFFLTMMLRQLMVTLTSGAPRF